MSDIKAIHLGLNERKGVELCSSFGFVSLLYKAAKEAS